MTWKLRAASGGQAGVSIHARGVQVSRLAQHVPGARGELPCAGRAALGKAPRKSLQVFDRRHAGQSLHCKQSGCVFCLSLVHVSLFK